VAHEEENPFMYRASQLDCQSCPLKSKCCPNMLHRKIERSPFEAARDVARALGKTARYRQSRRDRKKVEMLFAHMKRILRVDRLRGRSGAKNEFLLTAIAQNLRRLALSFPTRLTEAIPAPA
jgi:Transposase DDE domain